jgi:hypothetical protein
MATAREQFDWHINQAWHHLSTAINSSLGDHRVGLSQEEKARLEEAQLRLEEVMHKT